MCSSSTIYLLEGNMNFKYYIEAKIEETLSVESEKIEEGIYNPESGNLYQSTKQALDKHWGGKFPQEGIFTSELLSRLGLNISNLLKNNVIVPSPSGNYQLNKDLAATNGVMKKFEIPPPVMQKKPISWQDYIRRVKG